MTLEIRRVPPREVWAHLRQHANRDLREMVIAELLGLPRWSLAMQRETVLGFIEGHSLATVCTSPTGDKIVNPTPLGESILAAERRTH